MSFSLKAYRTYTSLIKYLVFQGVPVSVRCLSSVLWRSSRVRLCSVALSISESLRESVTFFHNRLKLENHMLYKHSSKKKKRMDTCKINSNFHKLHFLNHIYNFTRVIRIHTMLLMLMSKMLLFLLLFKLKIMYFFPSYITKILF